MSTGLTKNNIPMVESNALQLVLASSQLNDLVGKHLSTSLKEKGYEFVTPAMLNFLSTLECGVNYGSEIARNLGVSRQMVAKTVKELCRTGYLEQVSGIGKQKQILFTKTGELLMSDSRKILANLDSKLFDVLGEAGIKSTTSSLLSINDLLKAPNEE